MIYRNRAGRAAAAIIGGWVALRLIWLGSANDRPVKTGVPVSRAIGEIVVRNKSARPPHTAVPTDGAHIAREHGMVETIPAHRRSVLRALRAPGLTLSTVSTPDRNDARLVSRVAADSPDRSLFISMSDPAPPSAASGAASSAVASAAARSPGRSASRLSLSAWSIVRPGGNARALATSGMLGASQAGVRARLDLIEPDAGIVVAANLRLSTPLQSVAGREAGIGISLRPNRAIPLELIAETRIALDGGGRDRLAMLVAGGVSDKRLPFGLRLDAYGQTGIVGLRHPVAFADGAAVVERPLGEARGAGQPVIGLGVAVAGGAQPGAARFDIGPNLTFRQPLWQGGLRLSGGYRFRVAGMARPGSGPVLTIGVNF